MFAIYLSSVISALGDFRFRFSSEKGISFSSAFSFTAENEKKAFSVVLYIKLFQMIFKHSTIQVLDSLYRCLEKFYPPFLIQAFVIVIIIIIIIIITIIVVAYSK